jgi:hypothetical protein
MSYFRSYFSKNNTILKDSTINTAKSPTTEIYYGEGISRFIFTVDFNDLQNKISNGDLVVDSNTRHYLKMTNTVIGDSKLIGNDKSTGRQRATSFDLVLFELNEQWDEGVGYDYEFIEYIDEFGNKLYDQRPSNWFNKTTLSGWTSPGVYTTGSTIIATSHFVNGNENIDIDITNYVNGIILSGNTNYGLGIKFDQPYESVNNLETEQSVSFFSKYTQTFFEPFVESVFDDGIEDNRQNFIAERTNNLYLYVTKGTNFYDLDNQPTVDILDSLNIPISGLTGLTTTKIRKGIYKVSFGITGQLCDGKRFFYDKWKNLNIDGISISDITQKFVPKPFTFGYSIGENPTETQSYKIQFSGIKQNEKIIRGELKKIVLNLKSIEQPKTILFDEVYYRIFVKEGKTNVIVYDWTKTDVTNENSFFLDTSYLIPREYFMEFKAKTYTEEIFYDEYVKFEIISEK